MNTQDRKEMAMNTKNQSLYLHRGASSELIEPMNEGPKVYTVSQWFEHVHLLQDKWDEIDYNKNTQDNKGIVLRLLLFCCKGIQKILCRVVQFLSKK